MTLASALPWLICGVVLGAAYLGLIGRSVSAIAEGENWHAAALPLLLRIALAVAAFVFASWHGTLPVLSVLAGFLIARSVALRRVKGA